MAEIESTIHSITSANGAADLFPPFCGWLSFSLNSRTKPLLEMHLKALEHLFFNVFDVGELDPTSDIAVFMGTLKLHNEFFHEPPPVPVFFPEMLLANVRRLFLPVLGS
jgi:hypothetical protein